MALKATSRFLKKMRVQMKKIENKKELLCFLHHQPWKN
jgi:hypothetical protein